MWKKSIPTWNTRQFGHPLKAELQEMFEGSNTDPHKVSGEFSGCFRLLTNRGFRMPIWRAAGGWMVALY